MTHLDADERSRFLEIAETQLELEELGKLPADWNGYRANPINPAVIEAATRFLDAMPVDIPFRRPQVVPMTRGRLQLEWQIGGRELELEFASPSRLEYLQIEGDNSDAWWLELPRQATEAYEMIRWIGEAK